MSIYTVITSIQSSIEKPFYVALFETSESVLKKYFFGVMKENVP